MEIKHRYQLVELMKHFKLPLVAAELGIAEGRFSLELLQLGIEKLYMVDLWQYTNQSGDASNSQNWHDKNLNDAVERVDPYIDKIVFCKGYSDQMAAHVPDNSLGLVYLDADHSYEGVTKDLHAWWPKLVNGGIMAGHDFLSPEYGVKQAVLDFNMSDDLIHLIPEHKDEDSGFWFVKYKMIAKRIL